MLFFYYEDKKIFDLHKNILYLCKTFYQVMLKQLVHILTVVVVVVTGTIAR